MTDTEQMSELEQTAPSGRPAAPGQDDLDIDLGRFGRYLAHSWWLVLLIIVVAAIAAVAIAHFTANDYDATSSVYVGQATDATGSSIASASSNPKAAGSMATSASVLHEVAAETGVKIGTLEKVITVEYPTPTAKTSGQIVNFVTIHVRMTKAALAAEVANTDARAVRDRLALSPQRKIAFLKRRVAADTAQLAALDKSSAETRAQLQRIAASGQPEDQKALASTPFVAILQSNAATRAVVANELQSSKLLLLTAQNVEMPRVIASAAIPRSKIGLDWRIAAGIGVIAGAVIGIVVAVVRGRRMQLA